MENLYKALSLLSIEELEELEIPNEDGYVIGSMINDNRFPYIVGKIKRSASAYMQFEWQVPIDIETVTKHSGFKDKNEEDIFYNDILFNMINKDDDVETEVYTSLVEENGLPFILYLDKVDEEYRPRFKPQILKEWCANSISLKTNTKERVVF